VQAIILDFDGLILDTETPEFRVWTETFHEHGVELPAGYWSSVIGRGAEQEIERPAELLTRLTRGAYVDSPEKHEARRVKIRELIHQEAPRPGIINLLLESKDQGVPLAIASSSPHAWVDRLLKDLGLIGSFDHIVCADDVHRAKPFPDLYQLACALLGCLVDEAVALEDSPNGIAAAKAAGLYVFAVPNSVTCHLDLSMADQILDTLEGVGVEDLFRLRSSVVPI
jgi:HAD superfamily hydrolase (TIGR01509 family)